MSELHNHIQSADWKSEKHVPVIECPDSVKADEVFTVAVSLGKEIAHPNTTEHHIRWITIYFHPEGGKFAHEIAHIEFAAHGESPKGPNEGPVYTHHCASTGMKTNVSGMLHALAYCNIHGLWESSKNITVE
jgi:superoxide reductase